MFFAFLLVPFINGFVIVRVLSLFSELLFISFAGGVTVLILVGEFFNGDVTAEGRDDNISLLSTGVIVVLLASDAFTSDGEVATFPFSA